MANSVDLQVKVVALDFDGVIANLDVDWNAALRQASKIAGFEIKSLLTYYENNYSTPSFLKVSAQIEAIELCAIATAHPKPYAEDFLKSLQEKQVPIYIVSMQSLKPIKTFLEKHNLYEIPHRYNYQTRLPKQSSPNPIHLQRNKPQSQPDSAC